MKDRVTQNLKIIMVMKSCGKTDDEIAKYCGIPTKDYLSIIEQDSYLTECIQKAAEKVASEIEQKFIETVMAKLEQGDTTDAKFFLERTNKKYQKKDSIDLNVKSIDDIIRENGDK